MTIREFRAALAVVEDKSMTVRDLLREMDANGFGHGADVEVDLDALRWIGSDGPELVQVPGGVPRWMTEDGYFLITPLQGEVWEIEEYRHGEWVHSVCAASLSEARRLIAH